MATVLALAMKKHCSDCTLLYIDNQFLSLQHHAVIFVPAYCGTIELQCHLPPQICIESNFRVDFCPAFSLKTYL